jgi:hypothetical protein
MRKLPLRANCVVITLVGEWTKAKVLPENRVENVCNLSRRSGGHRILDAVGNE